LDVVIVLFPLLSFDTRGPESIKQTLSGQSACSIPSTNQKKKNTIAVETALKGNRDIVETSKLDTSYP
jgi:hypothetical protein